MTWFGRHDDATVVGYRRPGIVPGPHAQMQYAQMHRPSLRRSHSTTGTRPVECTHAASKGSAVP
ncbi:hypothetical protein NJ76_12845 [Rhodococcus sp. IITR03]|nr:hypothetical protein NJ76_12845 [Rhodococcus sp. IITR03]